MSTPDIISKLSALYVDCVKGSGRALAAGDVSLARALLIKANSAGAALEARGVRMPSLIK